MICERLLYTKVITYIMADTIVDKLNEINDIKQDIKSALEESGAIVGDTFADYPEAVRVICNIDLSPYITKEDADKAYMPKGTSSSSQDTSLTISATGAFNNFGNNGQAFNAVRDLTSTKYLDVNGSGYKLNAASFGVKDNGTTAFSHKKYDTFNKSTGASTGARNTAVLVFSGKSGLLYAKNTGSGNDVTDDMYKRVGVIDSPDVEQKVYSAAQVDNLLKAMQDKIDALQSQISEMKGNPESDNSTTTTTTTTTTNP